MAEQIRLSNDEYELLISTRGAEMRAFRPIGGKSRLWSGDPAVWAGIAPLLFPACGGLVGDSYIYNGKKYTMEKHGYIRRSEFAIIEHKKNTALFLSKSNAETKAVYPFDYELYVRYTLVGNKADVSYSVKNTGREIMYFQIGGHEGYAAPGGVGNYKLVFDGVETLDSSVLAGPVLSGKSVRVLTRSRELILKDEYFSVDALVFKEVLSRGVTLCTLDGKPCVRVEYQGFPYLLLWSKPKSEFICIEPWCGIGDTVGFSGTLPEREGINALAAGGVFERRHSITIY